MLNKKINKNNRKFYYIYLIKLMINIIKLKKKNKKIQQNQI
jgi:hypothetical protein